MMMTSSIDFVAGQCLLDLLAEEAIASEFAEIGRLTCGEVNETRAAITDMPSDIQRQLGTAVEDLVCVANFMVSMVLFRAAYGPQGQGACLPGRYGDLAAEGCWAEGCRTF